MSLLNMLNIMGPSPDPWGIPFNNEGFFHLKDVLAEISHLVNWI